MSAFSVFSLLALEDVQAKLSSNPKLSTKVPNKRGRKRKAPETTKIAELPTELKDPEISVKTKRVCKQNVPVTNEVIIKTPTQSYNRVTRSRKCDDKKQNVVNNDIIAFKKIKQEHEDFEFAKKVQNKLNKTYGKSWPKVEQPTRGYYTRSRKK